MPASGLQSAGLLLFRRRDGRIEILLGHPGGPFWRRKDQAAWTIPKGLIETGEDFRTAALREFAEETGYRPAGEDIDAFGGRQLLGIEAEFDGEIPVEPDQFRGGDNCRGLPREEATGQARIGIVEWKMNGHLRIRAAHPPSAVLP